MSGLTRWLEWDRERPDLEGGEKTPAFIDVPVHPSLETVVASKPNGYYQVVQRRNLDEDKQDIQRVGSFALAPEVEDEDQEQRRIVEFLYAQGARRNWGNVARREAIDEPFLGEAVEYLSEFNLDLYSIHAGGPGCRQLISDDVVDLVVDLDGSIEDERLQEVMEDEYSLGKVDGSPLFFNPHLGPYTVFSAESEYVGIGIRVRDRVGILIHNPIRGMVIAEQVS